LAAIPGVRFQRGRNLLNAAETMGIAPGDQKTTTLPARLGAHPNGRAVEFLVWAPKADRLEVCFSGSNQALSLEHNENGYFCGSFAAESGSRYFYRINGQLNRPDPASRWQPQGVHGPSAIVSTEFDWKDSGWRGIELEEFIFYEVHVGAYTHEGTFAALISRLAELRDLGITAIELMPIAEFPGSRNWGYDGVYPFAAHQAYGGPIALKRLVNACHALDLAIVLDVVYNHLGPEGNYLGDYGPYFTNCYRTPWGSAINFDGPHSDHVVRYFTENALQWLDEFHFDALRLDAIHGIIDRNASPFLACLSGAVDDLARVKGRHIHLIGESDANDFRVTQPRERGGFGLQAQWSDDFHHALHSLQTGERDGYYEDFGRVADLAKAFRSGFVYEGQYSAHRMQRHGSSAASITSERLVVCSQNHDQVGNRMLGERAARLLDFESLKVSAAAVLLSPFLPLIFMGEEFAADSSFLYFTSHQDQDLADAVRQGRRKEFAAFAWQGEPPDPQSVATFRASKVRTLDELSDQQRALRNFYIELIRLRRSVPALRDLSKDLVETTSSEGPALLVVRRGTEPNDVCMVLNFSQESVPCPALLKTGVWQCVLDSADIRWAGPGNSTLNRSSDEPLKQRQLAARSASLFCRGVV